MSADADHEVIDSPDALFRHLYEAHGVEEALDLDPETAPVQFWLRRHAELEREARLARRAAEPDRETPSEPPEPRHPEAEPAASPPGRQPGPDRAAGQPGAAAAGGQRPERPGPGREGRRPAAFGDPLVEAFARALAGRGHGEAAVRGAIRGYASPTSGRTGEAAVRGDLIEPMLRAAAERLLAGGRPPAGRPWPEEPAERRPQHAEPGRVGPGERPREPRQGGRGEWQEGPREPGRGGPREQPEEHGEAPAGAPRGRQEGSSPPEAAWAVFWADLADTGTRRGAGGGGDADDLMAIADAVQRRRRRRPAEREPRSLRR
jgi:hypothetical protein